MDTLESIRTRRSIKRFDSTHRMPKSEVDRLLELAALSPTSYNIQNWRFVTVTDRALKDRLCELSYGQRQVSEASLAVILCADLNSWDRDPGRYWQSAAEGERARLVSAIRGTYRGRPDEQRDEGMLSCGMAAQTIMLAARAMGYDTCPMKGFDYGAVGRLINLPDDHVIVMMVVVGRRAEDPSPRGGQLPLEDIAFEDGF